MNYDEALSELSGQPFLPGSGETPTDYQTRVDAFRRRKQEEEQRLAAQQAQQQAQIAEKAQRERTAAIRDIARQDEKNTKSYLEDVFKPKINELENQKAQIEDAWATDEKAAQPKLWGLIPGDSAAKARTEQYKQDWTNTKSQINSYAEGAQKLEATTRKNAAAADATYDLEYAHNTAKATGNPAEGAQALASALQKHTDASQPQDYRDAYAQEMASQGITVPTRKPVSATPQEIPQPETPQQAPAAPSQQTAPDTTPQPSTLNDQPPQQQPSPPQVLKQSIAETLQKDVLTGRTAIQGRKIQDTLSTGQWEGMTSGQKRQFIQDFQAKKQSDLNAYDAQQSLMSPERKAIVNEARGEPLSEGFLKDFGKEIKDRAQAGIVSPYAGVQDVVMGAVDTLSLLEAKVRGIAPEDTTLHAYAEGARNQTEGWMGEQKDSLVAQLGRGAGSSLAFLPAGYGGAAGIALAGAASTFGPGYFEAKQKAEQMGRPMSDTEAYFRALVAGGLGTTEALPISRAFNRLDKMTGGSFKVLIDPAKEGAEEWLQEFGQNAVQGFYDKLTNLDDRSWKEILGDSVNAGNIAAFSGLLMGIGMNAAAQSDWKKKYTQQADVLNNLEKNTQHMTADTVFERAANVLNQKDPEVAKMQSRLGELSQAITPTTPDAQRQVIENERTSLQTQLNERAFTPDQIKIASDLTDGTSAKFAANEAEIQRLKTEMEALRPEQGTFWNPTDYEKLSEVQQELSVRLAGRENLYRADHDEGTSQSFRQALAVSKEISKWPDAPADTNANGVPRGNSQQAIAKAIFKLSTTGTIDPADHHLIGSDGKRIFSKPDKAGNIFISNANTLNALNATTQLKQTYDAYKTNPESLRRSLQNQQGVATDQQEGQAQANAPASPANGTGNDAVHAGPATPGRYRVGARSLTNGEFAPNVGLEVTANSPEEAIRKVSENAPIQIPGNHQWDVSETLKEPANGQEAQTSTQGTNDQGKNTGQNLDPIAAAKQATEKIVRPLMPLFKGIRYENNPQSAEGGMWYDLTTGELVINAATLSTDNAEQMRRIAIEESIHAILVNSNADAEGIWKSVDDKTKESLYSAYERLRYNGTDFQNGHELLRLFFQKKIDFTADGRLTWEENGNLKTSEESMTGNASLIAKVQTALKQILDYLNGIIAKVGDTNAKELNRIKKNLQDRIEWLNKINQQGGDQYGQEERQRRQEVLTPSTPVASNQSGATTLNEKENQTQQTTTAIPTAPAIPATHSPAQTTRTNQPIQINGEQIPTAGEWAAKDPRGPGVASGTVALMPLRLLGINTTLSQAQDRINRDQTGAAQRQEIIRNMTSDNIPLAWNAGNSLIEGSPIIDPTGSVLVGNNRAMTLRELFASDNPKAQAYQQWALNKADTLGLNDAIKKFSGEPVAIVRIIHDTGGIQDFVKAANKAGTQEKTIAEKALSDAPILERIDPASNTALSDFYQSAGASEDMRDSNGQPDQAKVQSRMDNALLASLLRNAPDGGTTATKLIDSQGKGWAGNSFMSIIRPIATAARELRSKNKGPVADAIGSFAQKLIQNQISQKGNIEQAILQTAHQREANIEPGSDTETAQAIADALARKISYSITRTGNSKFDTETTTEGISELMADVNNAIISQSDQADMFAGPEDIRKKIQSAIARHFQKLETQSLATALRSQATASLPNVDEQARERIIDTALKSQVGKSMPKENRAAENTGQPSPGGRVAEENFSEIRKRFNADSYINPSPELSKKIVSAVNKSAETIDNLVNDFANSDKTDVEYDSFSEALNKVKADFENNSDSNTQFSIDIERSSGGYGRNYSESTYVTYDVNRESDAESYFNTNTIRFSRHGGERYDQTIKKAAEYEASGATSENSSSTPQTESRMVSGENIQPQSGKEVNPEVDKATGLPLNQDGTVTLYHGTTKEAASQIRKTRTIKSAAEPDVYFTTAQDGTGYGDGTVIALKLNPHQLILDDEFPNGRKDFRIEVGKSKQLKVQIAPESRAPGEGALQSQSTVTPEQDNAYMESVKAGDLEKAQRMVDEAAKLAGYTIKGFHGGSDSSIVVFDRPSYFSDAKSYADRFASVANWRGTAGVISAYIQPRKMRDMRGAGSLPITAKEFISEWNKGDSELSQNTALLIHSQERMNGQQPAWKYIAAIRNLNSSIWFREGADTIALKETLQDETGNIHQTNAWLVNLPSQIKSANPVTYDKKGNVIPLSQRFNTESNSILYSQGANPYLQAVKENPEALKNISQQFNRLFKTSVVEGKRLTPPQYRAMEQMEQALGQKLLFDLDKTSGSIRPTQLPLFSQSTEPFDVVDEAIARTELGQAQPYDEIVKTPLGWITLGELKERDEILNPDGGVQFIKAIYPQGTLGIRKITLESGKSVHASDDHLWLARDDNTANVTTTSKLHTGMLLPVM